MQALPEKQALLPLEVSIAPASPAPAADAITGAIAAPPAAATTTAAQALKMSPLADPVTGEDNEPLIYESWTTFSVGHGRLLLSSLAAIVGMLIFVLCLLGVTTFVSMSLFRFAGQSCLYCGHFTCTSFVFVSSR